MTADDFNKWRIIPRFLMIAYYGFFAWAFWGIADWFMDFDFTTIESEAVALAVVAFPTAILGVLSGVLLGLTKHYFSTPTP